MITQKQPIRILANAKASTVISRELSRRRFLSFAAAAAGTGLLAACSGEPAGVPSPEATGGALENSLSIYNWAGNNAPETLADFTSQLGPKIKVDAFSSNEELVSKLVSARGTSGYDIVVPTGDFLPQMIENELLMKLNHDLIPNLSQVNPAYAGRSWDPENEYSIPKAWGTTGFVYDKTKITRELHTWADFLDAAQNEASGKVSLLDDPAESAGIYFWANGIDWNTTDSAQLDACEDYLVNTLAPHLSAFEAYPGTGAIPQGTHMLMQAWNGDARLGILESADPDRWQWRIGAPATELWMDNWAIAQGAGNPEAAHAFINYALEPEVAARELSYIGYNTAVRGTRELAEAEGAELLDMIFFDDDQVATMHEAVLTDAQQRLIDIWSKVKTAAGA